MSWARRWIERVAFTAVISGKALLAPMVFGVHALVERDGRILLVRHSYMSGWSLPGGGVGRGEPPKAALLRELREEVGLTKASPPQFFGLYVRKIGWVGNAIALYRIAEADILFKPNLEIREITFADPAAPPPGTSAATLRRLAELAGDAPRSEIW